MHAVRLRSASAGPSRSRFSAGPACEHRVRSRSSFLPAHRYGRPRERQAPHVAGRRRLGSRGPRPVPNCVTPRPMWLLDRGGRRRNRTLCWRASPPENHIGCRPAARLRAGISPRPPVSPSVPTTRPVRRTRWCDAVTLPRRRPVVEGPAGRRAGTVITRDRI